MITACMCVRACVRVCGYMCRSHIPACGARLRRLQRVLTSQLIEAKKKQNELLRMSVKARPPAPKPT